MEKRIYLSPPNVGKLEKEAIIATLESGWVAPVGPQLTEFEQILSDYHQGKKALLTNSGTAALHLAVKLAGVEQGDSVLVSTFTFAASVNAVLYEKATPILLDSEKETWNICPELLENFLKKSETKPKALILTHLYGIPAKMEELVRICQEYEIVLIEDAAEALGSTYRDKPLGTFGHFGVISFNGNKIITTSAGGALVADEANCQRAEYLAKQANSGKYDYEHNEVGYNYRMSNLLAAVGLAQFQQINKMIERKRSIFEFYQNELADILDFPIEPPQSSCNRWLTTGLFKENADVLDFAKYMDEQNVEVRRLWKPLHLHKAYENFEVVLNGVSEKLHHQGICLPSGTGILEEELNFVVEKVREYQNKKQR